MNKINPLYILALFIMLTMVSFNFVNDGRTELIKNNGMLNHFKKDVLEYNQLKSNLTTKKERLSSLDVIIRDSDFIKANISSNIQKNRAVIKLVTSNKETMQTFLNRFLNKNIKINRMEATKKYITVEVEL